MSPPTNGTVVQNSKGERTPWFSGDRKEMMIFCFIVTGLVLSFIFTHLGIHLYKRAKRKSRNMSQRVNQYKLHRLRRREGALAARHSRTGNHNVEHASTSNEKGNRGKFLSFMARHKPSSPTPTATDNAADIEAFLKTNVIIPPRPYSRASSYRTEGILPSNQEHSVPDVSDPVESRPSSPVEGPTPRRLSRASSAHSIRELNTRYAALSKFKSIPEDGNGDNAETEQRADSPLPQRAMTPDLLRVATAYRSTSPGPSNLHLQSLRRNESQESLRRFRTQRYMRQMSLVSTMSLTSRRDSMLSLSSASISTGSDTLGASTISSTTLVGSEDGSYE